MEIDLNVLRLYDFISVDLTEASRWAMLKDCGDHCVTGEWQLGRRFWIVPETDIIRIGSELADRLSAFIKRVKMRSTKRPTTVRNPVASLKVDFIERPTIASPVISGTTEKP